MHPGELREAVTLPAGTTTRPVRKPGLGVLAAFLNTISAAAERSRELDSQDPAGLITESPPLSLFSGEHGGTETEENLNHQRRQHQRARTHQLAISTAEDSVVSPIPLTDGAGEDEPPQRIEAAGEERNQHKNKQLNTEMTMPRSAVVHDCQDRAADRYQEDDQSIPTGRSREQIQAAVLYSVDGSSATRRHGFSVASSYEARDEQRQPQIERLTGA